VFLTPLILLFSGLVGMLEKSGGMYGFTKDVSRFATTPRTGQLACFSVGIFVFFDDYANVLLAGETMRPLLDLLYVSREKLSFIVDATSAPIASLSPVSSWVGFEVGLIQTQLDIIVERAGTDDIGIKTSGLGVFLQSIKYRYYPIFMIVLMLGLIYSGRDFGPMLVAERKTQVYERSDGGDGKGVASKNGTSEKHNAPKEGTPLKSWNMLFPVLVLIFFIFYMLVKTGEEPGTSQSFMDKIENSNSYSALLWGTMAAVMLTTIFYLLQPVKDGKVLVPVPSVVKELFFSRKEKDEDAESLPRFLMTVHDSVESFLYGMGRIFPALIVLTLAWASGAIMIGVGADRLFSRWIVGGIDPKALPTLSFIISMFMALATGTSWGTMSILFPLILVPTYDASNGDPTIFYAVTAGVLSGSVAGDHMSPISDTTVLSALACDCDLIAHVTTQVPYAMLVVLTSIILGTVPIGYDAWPNIIGILLGAILLIGFVYGLCAPVVNATGRFDPVTELFIKFSSRGEKESSLLLLKEDTIKKAAGENVQESKDLDVSEDDSSKKLEEAVYETPIGVEAGDSREENENM
jgi:Na+/H+ antiporter NhaC